MLLKNLPNSITRRHVHEWGHTDRFSVTKLNQPRKDLNTILSLKRLAWDQSFFLNYKRLYGSRSNRITFMDYLCDFYEEDLRRFRHIAYGLRKNDQFLQRTDVAPAICVDSIERIFWRRLLRMAAKAKSMYNSPMDIQLNYKQPLSKNLLFFNTFITKRNIRLRFWFWSREIVGSLPRIRLRRVTTLCRREPRSISIPTSISLMVEAPHSRRFNVGYDNLFDPKLVALIKERSRCWHELNETWYKRRINSILKKFFKFKRKKVIIASRRIKNLALYPRYRIFIKKLLQQTIADKVTIGGVRLTQKLCLRRMRNLNKAFIHLTRKGVNTSFSHSFFDLVPWLLSYTQSCEFIRSRVGLGLKRRRRRLLKYLASTFFYACGTPRVLKLPPKVKYRKLCRLYKRLKPLNPTIKINKLKKKASILTTSKIWFGKKYRYKSYQLNYFKYYTTSSRGLPYQLCYLTLDTIFIVSNSLRFSQPAHVKDLPFVPSSYYNTPRTNPLNFTRAPAHDNQCTYRSATAFNFIDYISKRQVMRKILKTPHKRLSNAVWRAENLKKHLPRLSQARYWKTLPTCLSYSANLYKTTRYLPILNNSKILLKFNLYQKLGILSLTLERNFLLLNFPQARSIFLALDQKSKNSTRFGDFIKWFQLNVSFSGRSIFISTSLSFFKKKNYLSNIYNPLIASSTLTKKRGNHQTIFSTSNSIVTSLFSLNKNTRYLRGPVTLMSRLIRRHFVLNKITTINVVVSKTIKIFNAIWSGIMTPLCEVFNHPFNSVLLGDLSIPLKSGSFKFNASELSALFKDQLDRTRRLIDEKIKLGLISDDFEKKFDSMWWFFYKYLLLRLSYTQKHESTAGKYLSSSSDLASFTIAAETILFTKQQVISSNVGKRKKRIKKRVTKKLIKSAKRRLWVF